jgi:hypothetical protein
VKATPSFLKLFGIDLYSDSAIDIPDVAESGLFFLNLDCKVIFEEVYCINKLDYFYGTTAVSSSLSARSNRKL